MKWRKGVIFAMMLATMLGCSNRSYNSGDRVLVTKFAYDSGVGEPNRFDVVVFKYPVTPVEGGVPKNYIKRLLGLPGQILAIFFGQIFFYEPGPGEAPPHDDDKDPKTDPNELWRDAYMHVNHEKHLELFDKPGTFKILRKPPEVMLAMRRIVYDNDFPARDMTAAGLKHWNPDGTKGWNADKLNGFDHTSDQTDAVDWLRYQNLIRPSVGPLAGAKKEIISDFMDYNAGILGANEMFEATGSNWVGDLMLECDVSVPKGDGEFWLELSKSVHRFQAKFDLANGNCTLFKVRTADKDVKDSKEVREELGTALTRVKGSGNYSIRLANFDARLTLWVDGDLPFGEGKEYPPPEILAKGEDLTPAELEKHRLPTDNDLEPASVGSKGAAIKISHLRLWRDTHYTQNRRTPTPDATIKNNAWDDPRNWEIPDHPHPLSMYVQPGHYLCLGDNSPSSSDSRDWGLVPHRLMLGRALLVYFPLNRAGPIR